MSLFFFLLAQCFSVSVRLLHYCRTALLRFWDVRFSREYSHREPYATWLGQVRRFLCCILCCRWGRERGARKKNNVLAPTRLNSCPSAIVCTGGRSAVGGHALLRRAPGPEAPSAAQREGQRSALAAPVAAARQARSPALHGGRRYCGHRARLPGLAAHRCVSIYVLVGFLGFLFKGPGELRCGVWTSWMKKK